MNGRCDSSNLSSHSIPLDRGLSTAGDSPPQTAAGHGARTNPANSTVCKLRTVGARVILLMMLCIISNGARAFASGVDIPSNPEETRSLIQHKFDFYNKEFPRILFVHLEGGNDWQEDFSVLNMLLGPDADNLDYEHPQSLRAELFSLSLARIRTMLQRDIVSASLFRVYRRSSLTRPFVCVITLNPQTVAPNDRESTRQMLGLNDNLIDKINRSRFLNHSDHLAFAIDHEAYHCIDSYLFGGMPQSSNPLSTEYQSFRNESAADVFALAMHIKEHGSITRYANNLVLARALGITSDTPSHYTFDSLRELLCLDSAYLASRSTQGILELTRQIRDSNTGNSKTYQQHREAFISAANIFGNPSQPIIDTNKNQQDPMPPLVKLLTNRYEFYYGELFNDNPLP